MNSSLQKVYFHVGISKTGSTFLQKRVFPLLSKIAYIPTNRYQNIFLEIEKIKFGNVLVSREFDRQFEKEVFKFSNKYPQSTPIIVLRRHDEYFASQYRRFVKNGFTGGVGDFLNLEDDSGFFKKIHFTFKHQIDILTKAFSQKPIVYGEGWRSRHPSLILDGYIVGSSLQRASRRFKSSARPSGVTAVSPDESL